MVKMFINKVTKALMDDEKHKNREKEL